MHHSWLQKKYFNYNNLSNIQNSFNNKQYKYNFQHNLIPVIDNYENINSQEVYHLFYKERGAVIFKNIYNKNLMEKYNTWCISNIENAKKDKNNTHPKQKDKYLINDLLTRLLNTDIDLFKKIVLNEKLLNIMDIILGFGCYGSCTGHWINPGGDRQQSHVDYPIHVGSGKFWENSVDKLKGFTTREQINKIFPFFSFQLLIACDKMNIKNGSTEVVPGSHLIDDIDVFIHNKNVYNFFEDKFINVDLEQGDMLIFNRRLVHRGGKNLSLKRRNSIIIQSVYLLGIGQEIIEYKKIKNILEKDEWYNNLSKKEKENIQLRFKQPYPIDVKKNA